MKNDHQKTADQAIHALERLAETGDIEAVAAIRDIGLRAAAALENLTTHTETPGLPPSLAEAGRTARQLAKESRAWPVAYHSIKEIRTEDFGRVEILEVGGDLGVARTGKNRGMRYTQQTGFALEFHRKLEGIRRNPEGHRHPAETHPELADFLTPAQNYRTWRHLAAELEPLTRDSAKRWEDAAVELCRDLCRAKPDPWQWGHRMGANGLEIIAEDMAADWSKFPFPAAILAKAGKDPSGDGTLRPIESAIRGKISEGLNKLISQSRPRK
jgi:hypothetical protein